jgi:hypothetical protein
MTIGDFRKLPQGSEVGWDTEVSAVGIVRRSDNSGRRISWIEWSDGQRTEDYDDWGLAHVFVKTPATNPGRLS